MSPSDEGAAVPLKDFQHLSPTISLYQPTTESFPPRSPTPSPSFIILFPWLSAQSRHIAKYTAAYQTIFPSATILVLRTTPADMVYRPYNAQQANLTSVLPLLMSHAKFKSNSVSESDSEPRHKILLHMFSNAGAHQASQLIRAYQIHTQSPLVCGAMVLDSAPGVATYARITDAMIVGLPSIPVLRQVLAALVYVLVGLIFLRGLVFGGLNLVERARRDLNDMTLVESERGRLYLYSVGDRMVGWEDVESHGAEAERRGERVERERWVGTAHVGHMADDGERYWGAAKSLWGSG